MKLCVLVPSYHREDLLIRMIDTYEKAKKPLDARVQFIAYVQDSTPEKMEKLQSFAKTLVHSSADFVFVPKEPVPVIGNIRRNAWMNCKELVSTCDVLLCGDDDFWFTDDVCPLFELLERFADDEDSFTGFMRGFKNRKPGVVPAFDSKNEVIAGPAMDAGIVYNLRKYDISTVDWIYDKIFSSISVGEDIYILLKTMAMGIMPVNILGALASIAYDESFLSDTSKEGGGLHEMLAEIHKSVPKDMVKRNELMSRSDNSYVQYVMADFFHYDSAMSGFRRIRNDLIDYIAEFIEPTEQGIIRKPGWGLMKFDDSHRRVFGLDKKDYSTIDAKDREFKHYVNSQTYQNYEFKGY